MLCYRPYAASDGWVTLGALEPKFWQALCRGVGREDLVEHQFDRPARDAHRAVEEIFAARTRAEWQAFASEHDCCLEPVLELDEALDSELVRAREMVVELDQPGATQPVRALGVPVKLSRTPGDPHRRPGPSLGEHTRELLAEAGFGADEIAALVESGAVAGPPHDAIRRIVPVVSSAEGLLKMSELADRSGVSAGTIKHYLREGLLGSGDEVVRTSRNMAWYPPRVRRAHPADQAPAGGAVHAPAGDRPDDGRRPRPRGGADRARGPHPGARDHRPGDRPPDPGEVRAHYDVPDPVLDRLAEIGVLTPTERGYDRDDVAIIEAISRFRAGGYDEALGFTVYDTLRYKEALEPLVEEEISHAAGAPGRRGRGRPRRADHRQRRRAAARADRRDALQAAAQRPAPAGVRRIARFATTQSGSLTT